MKNNKKIYTYLPIVFALILTLGIYIGTKLAEVSSVNDRVFTLNTGKYSKLNEIINYIDQDYVDSVDKETIIEESIDEILHKLDPHSYYIPAEDFHEVNDPLKGNFEGIGIQFRIVKDTITVIHPIQGGPSEKVGLRAGDRIIRVDDSLVAGVNINNAGAISKLKGKRGSEVSIDVYRRGEEKLLDFTITRDVIPTNSLDIAYMVNENTGYIKLNKFSATTYEEFMDALKNLKAKGLEHLILDLRGNVGGYLQAAIKIADEFLKDEQLIVYTKGNSRPKNMAYATEKGIFEQGELVILIDEGSASASEIVAGAVQDNDRGTIIGRRSFGKGLVQEQLNFPDGSALRLTVARYYTPTGRSIQKPYDEDFEDYYHESYERFLNGELQNSDSIQFHDSLKYITPGGKIVYGGGGIMPDIFVPLHRYEEEVFYNKVLRRGLIYQFAFNYTDQHRTELKSSGKLGKFIENYYISDTVYDQFVEYTREKGVDATAEETRQSEDRIKMLLKAYLAQNIYDDEGFYPVFHQIDDVFLKAIEYIETNQHNI